MGTSRKPAIIVGGGIAGLSAAALIARAGQRTVLLERSSAVGGRARSQEEHGYTFNLGPHALAQHGPGTELLEDLGIELSGGDPLSRPFKYFVDGRIVSVEDREQGGPGSDLYSALGKAFRDARDLRTLADKTALTWLHGLTDDDQVRGALRAIGRLGLYADALEVAAADNLGAALRSNPTRYIDGGWQRLVDALRDTAVDLGVDIRRGREVAHVQVADGAVAGVELADSTILPAQSVVLAAGGPTGSLPLLDRELLGRYRDVVRQAQPIKMACLDVALSGGAPEPSVVLGTDQPLYLSVHSHFADLTPDDGALVHVARFLQPGQHAPSLTRAELEHFLSIAIPGWRDHLVRRRYMPGVTVCHDLPTPERGGLAARMPVTIADVHGLAFAGDWVGHRGMLAHAALASASEAAEAVVAVAPQQVARH